MALHSRIQVLLFGALACVAPACHAQDPARPLLLVVTKGDTTLALVDPEKLEVVGRVPVGPGPHEVTASADGRTAVVANYGDQQLGTTLSVVDLPVRKERRIDLGALRRPHGLVEVNGKFFFTAEINQSVARYDPAADKVDWLMGVGQVGTHMVVAAPDRKRLYTADVASDSVSVVELAPAPGTPQVRHVPVGKNPEGIALSPDGKELWVGQLGGGISIVDTARLKVTATIPDAGPMPRLRFTPDGKRVLGSESQAGNLAIFDAGARKLEKRLPLCPGTGTVVVTPDGRRAFVGVIAKGGVAIVDLQRLEETGFVATGPGPDGMAWAAPARAAVAPAEPAKTAVAPQAPAAPAAPEGPLRRRPFLGTQLAPVPDDVRAKAGLGAEEGVLVAGILLGGSAQAAGLQPGDVLLALNGKKLQGPLAQFITAIGQLRAGDRIELEVLRDGKRSKQVVDLKERPRDSGDGYQVLYEQVASRGARIRTIVTRPEGEGKHPVLFLIQGLGPALMDRPLAGDEPYSRILREFAKSGYVTVRVEKPGVGDSESGPYADTDYLTELDAYRQALKAVLTYPWVDPDNVFIFGHSMGGAFGPMLAAETPVRGVAVYGTVAKTWYEYFLENQRRQRALAGDDPAAIDAGVRAHAAALHLLLVEKESPAEVRQAHPELAGTLEDLLPDGVHLSGRALPFWIQLLAENFPAYWEKGDHDVLAIWGKNEFIATEADHPLIAAIVNRVRPGKGTYLALEGSDHGFKQTTSMQDSFTRWQMPGEMNLAIIPALKEWVESKRKR